jgi:Uncharacterized conserved protein, contains double-stranded beta-helix domain
MRKESLEVISTNTCATPWEPHTELGKTFFMKTFCADKNTGMLVQEVVYPKGYKITWHKHNCSHGIYVLEGILETHEGVYGPGSFVWFPEGNLAEHGAAEECSARVLFITNKTFDIQYKNR